MRDLGELHKTHLHHMPHAYIVFLQDLFTSPENIFSAESTNDSVWASKDDGKLTNKQCFI